MNAPVNIELKPFVGKLRQSGLLMRDIDYHVVRASMVIMYFFFGYQKWWPYEAERLVPFISCSATEAPAGFSGYPNGPSARCCSPVSGTNGWASSVRPVRP
jgi:hypothetical protein